ncbi:MAG: hypothetical protein QY327_07520 [Fimbriimonadaceae bacterium]|nr:MAG: hypothetical protein UZ18_ATM001001645 [Armatimonadetes bacterium OLB18]WKZ79184.1 MAG: hypothetical protein QY327_07520 [Fimbriimonadaceae bacterium]
MKKLGLRKISFVMAAVLALAAIGAPQLDKLLKLGGVVAIVNAMGKQMNEGINKLWGRKDTWEVKTKVVPILSVGINSSTAVGAAQVMGPPHQVDKVVAVAQPEAQLLGRELRMKALIPVSSKDVLKDIRAVEHVGVSGIVDIKL